MPNVAISFTPVVRNSVDVEAFIVGGRVQFGSFG